MQITGVQQNTASYQQVNKQQGDDPVIKNAQSQIEELRKQLQQLAENKDMDPKTKTEKKQQIQQQISDLTAQIRQRQNEMRREKQASAKARAETPREEAKNESAGVSGGFSKNAAGALISASNALDSADALSGLNAKLSGRARELNAEIETDLKRGADVTAKQAELDKVNKGVKNTASAAADVLSEAGETLENAADKEKEAAGVKEDEVKTEGMYDKDGNRIEEKHGNEESDFKDKA